MLFIRMMAITVASNLIIPTTVFADTFNVTAISGQKSRVHTYMSWQTKDCTPNKGIVKLASKPQHGRAIPGEVDATIRHSRFRDNDPCIGKPMKGFSVEYQSDDGYHGSDTFTIEATYGNRRPVIDLYNVTVK